MAKKYFVFRRSDIKNFLTAAQQEQLALLHRAIEAKRLEKGMTQNDHFFTLNMKDQYALRAVESYMEGIQLDTANGGAQGVKDAYAAASEAREKAIMVMTPKLPD